MGRPTQRRHPLTAVPRGRMTPETFPEMHDGCSGWAVVPRQLAASRVAHTGRWLEITSCGIVCTTDLRSPSRLALPPLSLVGLPQSSRCSCVPAARDPAAERTTR